MDEAVIRIVLADDHAVVRQGIRDFLEDERDLRVVAEAADGAAAKALVREHQPDVAILDIRMPHAGGIEVAAWIQEQHLPVRVLILTSYDDEPYVVAAMQAGMRQALNSAELKSQWTGLGTETPDLLGDDFGRFVASEVKRWAEVVKTSGAKLD